MSSPDPAVVAAACEAWTWYPPDAEVVETGDYLLVRFPDHFAENTQVLRTTSRRPLPQLWREVAEQVRRWDRPEVVWWVRLGSRPPDLSDELQSLGGRLHERLAVLARDIGPSSVPDSEVSGLRIEPVGDVPTLRDIAHVDTGVFGGSAPPDEGAQSRAAECAAAWRRGEEVRLVAYLDGEPVGTAGASLADGVLRLWGGGVLAESRGRGIYRALLAWRLRWGLEQGATLALVKGRVDTSGPILQRLGFSAYGEETSWLLRC